MTTETASYSDGVLVQRVVSDDVAQTVTVFDGNGSQVSSRPWTAQEIAKKQADDAAAAVQEQQNVNAGTVRQRAAQALAGNTTYLGHAAVPSGTLTTAQLSSIARQLTDQVDAITRQNNGIIRLLLNQLDDISDT